MQEIRLHRTFDGERKIPYFDADGNFSFASVKRNADLSGIFACRLRLRRADGYPITLIFARINVAGVICLFAVRTVEHRYERIGIKPRFSRKTLFVNFDITLSVKREIKFVSAFVQNVRNADFNIFYISVKSEQELHPLALILCKKSRKSAVFRLCRNFVPQKVFCVRHNVNVFDVDQLLFILFFASGDDCERKYRNKNCCHCLFHGFSPFPLYAFSSLFFLSSASLFEKTHPQ